MMNFPGFETKLSNNCFNQDSCSKNCSMYYLFVKTLKHQMWKIANIEKHFLLYIHKTAKHSLYELAFYRKLFKLLFIDV